MDTASGEICVEEERAHDGAVWSISMQPPDGKGFVTGGADKLVKFWDFTVRVDVVACLDSDSLLSFDGLAHFLHLQVHKGVLGIELSRQLVMTHDVMAVSFRLALR